MKILFSPAETKKSGGSDCEFSEESFLFHEFYGKRLEVLEIYSEYLQRASDEELMKLFGLKDKQKCLRYKKNLFQQPIMKVIERYSGVAFDYLEYDKLEKTSQEYIDKNTIIFSNLFGPLMAGDFGIPEYKLKQGEKIDGFAAEAFYKKHFTKVLDSFLQDEVFLDLRAGFYTKFYKPSTAYVTLKFLKNDKVVSHWAKAYRGIVLKAIAEEKIESIDAFMKMELAGLRVKEIIKKGIHTEIVYDIFYSK